MIDIDKLKTRIETEEDFIHCPKMGNSVDRVVEKYPDGVDDTYISKVMLMTEDEVKEIYQSILDKFRLALKIK